MLIKFENYLNSQVVRWVIVGGITVLIDSVVFTMLYRNLNQILTSNLVSITFSTLFNYFMHHKITFQSKKTHNASGAKYLVTLLFFWIFNTICVQLLMTYLFQPFLSKIITALIQAPFGYLTLKKKVFN